MSLVPAAETEDKPQRKPHQTFKGHTDTLRDVVHLPDGQHIITCSQDGSLRLWNLKNGLQIGKPWMDGKSPVFTIALSPDGKTVMSGSKNSDGIMTLWNIKTGKMIAKWTGHSGRVLSICWCRDSQRVVSGSSDGTARMWDVKSGETVLGPIDIGYKYVRAVVYSPNETIIATGGCNGVGERGGGDKVKIWDAKTFKLVTTLKGCTESVDCLSWTKDGKTIVSASIQGSITIWNTNTWKQVAVLTEHHQVIYRIAISPNGRILASASKDCTARLWDLENCQLIGSPLQHPDQVCRISFSGDGALLATGCLDSNAYTWDVPAIVEEAGFNDLLLDSDLQGRKSILDADPTRRLPQPVNLTRRLQRGFFDDTGDRLQSSLTNTDTPTYQPSISRPRALIIHFSSLFSHSRSTVRSDATLRGASGPSHTIVRDTALHRALIPFHFLDSTLALFSRHHCPDTERRPPEVEVPCTRGQARNIKVTRKSKVKKVPVRSNIMNISVAGPSRPSNSVAMQQLSEATHGQQSSQPQDSLTMTHTNVVTSAAGMALPSDIIIRQAGCWTRLWLFFCCVSSDDAAGHI